LFFIPGLIAFALVKSGQLNYESYDQAFPTLVGGFSAGIKKDLINSAVIINILTLILVCFL